MQGMDREQRKPLASRADPHVSVRGWQFARWARDGMWDVSGGAGLCPAPALPARPVRFDQRQAAITEEHTLHSFWLPLDAPDAAGQQADQQYLAHGLPKPERNHSTALGIYELSAPQRESKRQG